jgi:phosphohistidine phosphatase SixA
VIRKLPSDSNCALCVGHNPGIEALVASLTGEFQHMSTAAVAVLELPVDDWRLFDPLKPLPQWTLWRPKELDD